MSWTRCQSQQIRWQLLWMSLVVQVPLTSVQGDQGRPSVRPVRAALSKIAGGMVICGRAPHRRLDLVRSQVLSGFPDPVHFDLLPIRSSTSHASSTDAVCSRLHACCAATIGARSCKPPVWSPWPRWPLVRRLDCDPPSLPQCPVRQARSAFSDAAPPEWITFG